MTQSVVRAVMAPGPEQYYRMAVLGLTGGELFVIGFVVFLVVSARFWPMLGERVAQALSRREDRPSDRGRDESRALTPFANWCSRAE